MCKRSPFSKAFIKVRINAVRLRNRCGNEQKSHIFHQKQPKNVWERLFCVGTALIQRIQQLEEKLKLNH